MVFAVDPYSLRAIVTGWYDRARSPEARNARPFYHLFGPARESRAVARGPARMSVDRRRFLTISAASLGGALLSACDKNPEERAKLLALAERGELSASRKDCSATRR